MREDIQIFKQNMIPSTYSVEKPDSSQVTSEFVNSESQKPRNSIQSSESPFMVYGFENQLPQKTE